MQRRKLKEINVRKEKGAIFLFCYSALGAPYIAHRAGGQLRCASRKPRTGTAAEGFKEFGRGAVMAECEPPDSYNGNSKGFGYVFARSPWVSCWHLQVPGRV